VSRSAYYNDLKALAREKRALHQVDTYAFGLREARLIYKTEGIQIDHWPLPSKIKALYMCGDGQPSVALKKSLPDQPKLFALMHEYKHHLADRESLGNGVIHCGDYNVNEEIEIGAEVFAAEFIYPEDECLGDLQASGVADWQPEHVVRFKQSCSVKVSYIFLCKRLEWFGLIAPNQFAGIKFQKLEEQMFGVPFYRRRQAARAR
jgi:Zn-dependent peptidase ImmA (M78 family)